MEWQNGLIAGMPCDEARKKYPRPEINILYGQESDFQFRMRVETALSKIVNENPVDSTIAIISHGGMIICFSRVLKLPVNSEVYISKGDTGIHEWCTDGNSQRIIYINQ